MEEDNKIDSSEEKGSRRGSFMRTFRAVLFHIKLKSINREKRIGSDSMRTSSSSFSFWFRKQSHDNTVSKSGLLKSASTCSTSPSILSSSSSSSFPSSEPRTSVSSTTNHQNPKPQKQCSFKEQSATSVEKQSSVKGEGQRQRSSASIMIGLVLILILMSLGLTILWGRVWAIAFNAMWLAYVRQKRSWRRELGSDDDEVARVVIKEMRKRVIMEGLLDRTQHHRQSWQQWKL